MNVRKFWTDEEILEELSQEKQKRAAIRQLYIGYYQSLQGYILDNQGSEAEAAETIQKSMLVFLNMVETGKFSKGSAVGPVLERVNRNLWAGTLADRKSEKRSADPGPDMTQSGNGDVARSLAEIKGYQLINALYEKLGNKCKKILMLYHFESLSLKEIAVEMDYGSELLVREDIDRCMIKLTAQLSENKHACNLVRKAIDDGK
ncbi:DNA-directed RNA polymerase specialized sigma subunit, sigma24 family [Cyclobacterium lianum]|uniref:DNA-directed RNA polymerase specialized sigma subunit, sigma24 family n=1 Tax=Cyclobacterium lianum TaxID=388280 RepID=A0A1M7PDN9_9BACT|nr:sigma-70 family RNA polymerase sigma factor [Cyclobacterium lianum]SHN14740.1 DNA-directed RNA polymerase specialized sigma subunit, sigma24 family [Cyclobacterium lianum]